MPTILDGSGSADFNTALPLTEGGTGATTAAAARTALEVIYPVFARVVRTAGNITTTSTSLVDVTGATVTFTTGAFPVAYGTTQVATNSTAANEVWFNIQIDGGNELGTDGWREYVTVANAQNNVSFSGQSAALTAGSHTIKERWMVGATTGTIFANANTSHLFYAQEIR